MKKFLAINHELVARSYILFPTLLFAFSIIAHANICLLYTSPSPRDGATSRMPSSA